MLVTVLMPVFNGEEYIKDAIESILSQTMGDYEFLMINDGSSDYSLDIMMEYERIDKRIRLISKNNTGITDTLRYGMSIAKGKWVARQDVDDISEKERLSRQLDYVRSNSRTRLVGCGMRAINREGTLVSEYRYPSEEKALIKGMVSSGKMFPHTSAFIDKSAALSVGNYRGRIKRGQDIDLWMRISERYSISCLDEALVKVRIHESQVSKKEGGLEMMTYQKIVLASRYEREESGTDFVDDLASDETFMNIVTQAKELVKNSGVLEWIEFTVFIRSVLRGRLNLRDRISIRRCAAALKYRADRNKIGRIILVLAKKKMKDNGSNLAEDLR